MAHLSILWPYAGSNLDTIFVRPNLGSIDHFIEASAASYHGPWPLLLRVCVCLESKMPPKLRCIIGCTKIMRAAASPSPGGQQYFSSPVGNTKPAAFGVRANSPGSPVPCKGPYQGPLSAAQQPMPQNMPPVPVSTQPAAPMQQVPMQPPAQMSTQPTAPMMQQMPMQQVPIQPAQPMLQTMQQAMQQPMQQGVLQPTYHPSQPEMQPAMPQQMQQPMVQELMPTIPVQMQPMQPMVQQVQQVQQVPQVQPATMQAMPQVQTAVPQPAPMQQVGPPTYQQPLLPPPMDQQPSSQSMQPGMAGMPATYPGYDQSLGAVRVCH